MPLMRRTEHSTETVRYVVIYISLNIFHLLSYFIAFFSLIFREFACNSHGQSRRFARYLDFLNCRLIWRVNLIWMAFGLTRHSIRYFLSIFFSEAKVYYGNEGFYFYSHSSDIRCFNANVPYFFDGNSKLIAIAAERIYIDGKCPNPTRFNMMPPPLLLLLL